MTIISVTQPFPPPPSPRPPQSRVSNLSSTLTALDTDLVRLREEIARKERERQEGSLALDNANRELEEGEVA